MILNFSTDMMVLFSDLPIQIQKIKFRFVNFLNVINLYKDY